MSWATAARRRRVPRSRCPASPRSRRSPARTPPALALKTDGTVWRWGQELPVRRARRRRLPQLHPSPGARTVRPGGDRDRRRRAVRLRGHGRPHRPYLGLRGRRDRDPRSAASPASSPWRPAASTAYALDSSGFVHAWGSGGRGQLGNGKHQQQLRAGRGRPAGQALADRRQRRLGLRRRGRPHGLGLGRQRHRRAR